MKSEIKGMDNHCFGGSFFPGVHTAALYFLHDRKGPDACSSSFKSIISIGLNSILVALITSLFHKQKLGLQPRNWRVEWETQPNP